MVTLAPRWVSELHMITGILCPCARNFLSVTNPSITGISTSSRTRSGRRVSIAPKAAWPSAAVPATSKPASLLTTARNRLRITAESSAIKILIRSPEAIAQSSTRPSMTSFSVSASSSNGFMRYSSAPASRARRIYAFSASVVTIITFTSP